MRPGIPAVILAMVLAPAASAYELVEHAFEKNVQRSDLVAIGSVMSERHPIAADASGLEYVTIEVRKVLKGRTVQRFELLVTPEDVEFDPQCCVRSGTYLFLLKEIGPLRYEAVNGRFGVHQVN